MLSQNEHEENQHEGTDHVRNTVQEKMWILGIRNTFRSVRNKCVTCKKGRAQTITPVVADLHEVHLDASQALTKTGVDYLGPFIVKIVQRTVKRRCCLFTSITVTAVHIDVGPRWTQIVVSKQLGGLLRQGTRRLQLSVTTQRFSEKLNESLRSRLLDGTKKRWQKR